MSQTETIMLIGLGFVFALIIGLLVIRGVWQYAVGLGKRRIERRAPSAIAELKADRDRLKAEFAMQGRRLQSRLDDLKTRMAEQMAEVSRHRNRIEQLASEISNRDSLIAQRESEAAALKSQLESLERELVERTAITQQARDDVRQRDEDIEALRARLSDAEGNLADQTAQLSNLHTAHGAIAASGSSAAMASAAGNEADAMAHAEQVESRLRKRIAELNALTRQIDEQRRDLSFQQNELTTIREQLDRSRQLDLADDSGSPAETGASSREPEQPSISLIDIESASEKLDRQIQEAERETQNLTTELSRLDEVWNSNLMQIEANKDQTTASKPPRGKQRTAGKKTAARKSRSSKKAASKAEAGTKETAKKSAKTAASKSTSGKAGASRSTPARSTKPGKPAKIEKTAAAHGKPRTAGKRKDQQDKTTAPGETAQDNVISLAQRIRALQGDLGSKGS